jgi:pyruvate dehydrogenase E2 component (dihydrolipoamide acetyltransferase)
VIAKRLTESKLTVPHLYSSIECDITELLSLRSKFKKEASVNVSVNDLVIKASALALRDVPECNGFWNPKTEQSELNPTIDISVAVATPNGLITPIVPQVDTLGLSSISSKVKDLAGRARDGKLKPNEYQGGTFTISNLGSLTSLRLHLPSLLLSSSSSSSPLGMFGISSFTAVINPPQACILAVGSGIQRVIPNEKDPNEVKVTTTMTVQLSSDRRVVDEATAGQFLQAFRAYLGNPTLLLL